MAPPNPRKRSREQVGGTDEQLVGGTDERLLKFRRSRESVNEKIRKLESKERRYEKKLRQDIDEAGSHEVPSGAVVAVSSQGRAASNYDIIPEKESVDFRPILGTLEAYPTSSKPTQNLLMDTNHKKVIRSIDFLPSNPSHFVTSDNGGWIQKTQLRPISTSPRAKDILYFNASIRGLFPVAVSVNPVDESLVACYGQNEKLAVVSLEKDNELGEERVQVIKKKPHMAGVEQVSFMPWINNPTFVSCGKLHDIVSWRKKGSKWKPNRSRYTLHTNFITGIAGAFHMPWVISVGKDKRMLVYDLQDESVVKEELIDEQCLGVAVNPCDYNLACVQTSEVDGQLRLFDLRQGFVSQLSTRVTSQLHEFGWEYDHSDNDPNSALVRPSWSSTGLLLSCGSAESNVRIFDIRYHDSRNPVFIFKKHTKKVYQVAWAPSSTTLVTTSADHSIGLLEWK